ncbi:MAG: sodium:proton antiporter [Lachnospiraceae bacterium]|nr:sodium:proton antiporter [Lachnospiraceae bacterium]
MEVYMSIPVWLCIPFVGMLLCIALGPILVEEWWENKKQYVVAGWSILTIVLFAVVFGVSDSAEVTLECIFNDYLTFIILLFGLFCVSGNISFKGDLAGSPHVNMFLLTVGTILSSLIGTTGSSMLMVRPVLKMNSWRTRKSHLMIFFIFMVSNLGGILTPIGDPPLLMGFMRGVPFQWSLNLFPMMLLNMVILLTVFYFLDRKFYRMDVAEGRMPDISKPGTTLTLSGKHNIIFLIMIVGAVVLSGVLPSVPAFQNADGTVKGIPIFGEVTFGFPSLIECVIILLAAWLSFKTTPEKIRRKNHFTWSAIEEVAILFIGIFITMQPALLLLKEVGPKLGLTTPTQMFWITGALSSFLDNTPTYLVFLTTAGTLGATAGISTAVGVIPVKLLEAISCGAVFMGANTYIGNAPNFMVKTLSDENGVKMPSFFGYMKWSFAILIPTFLVDMLVFFLF